MGVVFPDDNLRSRDGAFEVPNEGIKRFRHVAVAEVPRRDAPVKHIAVIFLGVFDDTRILFGEEIFVEGRLQSGLLVLRSAAAEFNELANDFLLASLVSF